MKQDWILSRDSFHVEAEPTSAETTGTERRLAAYGKELQKPTNMPSDNVSGENSTGSMVQGLKEISPGESETPESTFESMGSFSRDTRYGKEEQHD